jgi:hypothetical protein
MRRLLAALLALLLSTQLTLATQQVAATGTGAGTQTITATHITDLVWYISGFTASCGGATAAGVNNGTLAGLAGGTVNFVIGGPLGPGTQGYPVTIIFPQPIPNAATTTDVVLTVPSPGSGNTVCSGTIFGELR